MAEGYDTMQVCLNGHMITATAATAPQFKQEFCSTCGAKTITACSSCQTDIRGFYHIPGVFSLNEPEVPKYCSSCGSAFPWQKSAIENLEGILREGGLSVAELGEASDALPDVVRETPKTKLAALKFKRILGKLGKPMYEIAINVISDIASETAKKTMGLNT